MTDVPETVATAIKIIKRVKEFDPGMQVIMYHSQAYDSVYVKFDMGVANSLRVADHKSKKDHLEYKYNVLVGLAAGYTIQGEKTEMYFYTAMDRDIENLAKTIASAANHKRQKYGDQKYKYYMEQNEDRLPDCNWLDM